MLVAFVIFILHLKCFISCYGLVFHLITTLSLKRNDDVTVAVNEHLKKYFTILNEKKKDKFWITILWSDNFKIIKIFELLMLAVNEHLKLNFTIQKEKKEDKFWIITL